MKKILICVGTRPNFIKVTQFKKRVSQITDNMKFKILHTGQHFDEKMSEIFFNQLELDKPDYFLGVSGGSQVSVIARIMEAFEIVLQENEFDMVLVPGDVNSSLACAIVASRLGIPLGHIESGLRSGDRTMPEEINRILIDDLSDLLLVSEESGLRNLAREGKDKRKVFHVGNTMIDSLAAFSEKIEGAKLEMVKSVSDFALVTFHRPSNVDGHSSIRNFLIPVLQQLAERLNVVFPVHPRTRNRLESLGLMQELRGIDNIMLTAPLGYLEFQNLLGKARVVVTDSGGIQEETTYLGVPCVTARENTERPSTIDEGTNTLAGTSVEAILQAVDKVVAGQYKTGTVPKYWDGNATDRIIEVLDQYLSAKEEG